MLTSFLIFSVVVQGPHIAKVASTAVSLGSADFSAEMKQFFRFPVDFSVSSITKAFQPVYAPDAWNPVTGRYSYCQCNIFSIRL